jgi:hypothetical protein
MALEHQTMLDLDVPNELPQGFDPVEMQRDLQAIIREKMPDHLRNRIATERLDTFQEVLDVVRPQIENVMMELAEILDQLPWKYWRDQHRTILDRSMDEYDRTEIAFEVADILHFLINILVVLGIDWDLFMRIFYAKQIENRSRQNRGY